MPEQRKLLSISLVSVMMMMRVREGDARVNVHCCKCKCVGMNTRTMAGEGGCTGLAEMDLASMRYPFRGTFP